MPSSHWHQLNEIMELIALANPKSVLDVGVGFGKYGFLSREYLELWDGRQKYSDWQRRIDGIEVCEGYLTPVHDFVYDRIYLGDAAEIIPTLQMRYDLILLVDILEHFDHEEGVKLLSDCQRVGKGILISTPKNVTYQQDAFGNPHEAHKCQWREHHFRRFEKKLFIPNELSLICYLGESAHQIGKQIRNIRIRRRVKRLFPFLKYPLRAARGLLHRLETHNCRGVEL